MSAGTLTPFSQEKLDRRAAHLCQSLWHDEGHSSHSTCYTCGKKFMRGAELEAERQRLAGMEKWAEAWALANGWTRP